MRIIIQSESSPSHLEDRIEAFLDEMKERLANMKPEDFEEHKISLEKQWLEVNKNLNDEFSKFLVHVNSGQYDFLRSKSRKGIPGLLTNAASQIKRMLSSCAM